MCASSHCPQQCNTTQAARGKCSAAAAMTSKCVQKQHGSKPVHYQPHCNAVLRQQACTHCIAQASGMHSAATASSGNQHMLATSTAQHHAAAAAAAVSVHYSPLHISPTATHTRDMQCCRHAALHRLQALHWQVLHTCSPFPHALGVQPQQHAA